MRESLVRVCRGPVALGLLLVLLMGLSTGSAYAHLDLESTSPTDGADLQKPIKRITLNFTNPGQLVGSGINLFDQAGEQLATDVSTPDGGRTWLVEVDERLPSGAYGVKWKVAAPDAHPKTGKFRFSITGGSANKSPNAPPISAEQLDEALAEPSSGIGPAVQWFGLAAAISGSLVVIGGLIFLAVVMAGRPVELRRFRHLIRLAAAAVIVGTGIQVVGESAIRQDGDWSQAFLPNSLAETLGQGSYFWSVILRLVGSLCVLIGLSAKMRVASLAAQPQTNTERFYVANLAKSPIAWLGAAGILVSFIFDGHTVTVMPRWLVVTSDLFHVVAAASWVAGLLFLAVLFAMRRRRRHSYDGSYVIVRFSSVASFAVAAVGLTGIAMTWLILDDPAQLWSTSWGRLLLVKVCLVMIVVAMGAYNHFRLMPLLEPRATLDSSTELRSAQDKLTSDGAVAVSITEEESVSISEDVSRKIQRSVAIEVAIVLLVIVVTALLVNASTVT